MPESQHPLKSVHLGNERTIWVRAPADPANASTVVILLDAEFYREKIEAPQAIEELIRNGRIADAWFVHVSHASLEARWIECPCHPPFARFISDELLPWLVRNFPKMRGATRWVITGVSYTGLAAAYVALETGLFDAVIAQSGSFWSNDGWLTKRVTERDKAIDTAFYLEVGVRETQENLRHKDDVFQAISQIEGVRRFRDALLSKGAVVEYREFDGGHEFGAWKKTLPGALEWALAQPGRV